MKFAAAIVILASQKYCKRIGARHYARVLFWGVFTRLQVLRVAVLCRVQKNDGSPRKGSKAVHCVLARQNRRTGLRRKVLSEHCSACRPGECLISPSGLATFSRSTLHIGSLGYSRVTLIGREPKASSRE